jgi:hypothetical protein
LVFEDYSLGQKCFKETIKSFCRLKKDFYLKKTPKMKYDWKCVR